MKSKGKREKVIVSLSIDKKLEYYSSLLTVGNKYELIDSDAFEGPNGFEKVYFNAW